MASLDLAFSEQCADYLSGKSKTIPRSDILTTEQQEYLARIALCGHNAAEAMNRDDTTMSNFWIANANNIMKTWDESPFTRGQFNIVYCEAYNATRRE